MITVTRDGPLLRIQRDGVWSMDDTVPIPTIGHVSIDVLRWNRPVRVGPLEYGFGDDEGGYDAARAFYVEVSAAVLAYYVEGGRAGG